MSELDEFLPPSPELGSVDRQVARGLVALANRTTRRSFLAWTGRASIALMGAGYLTLWRSESAFAACGGQGDPHARETCMCGEVGGSSNFECLSGTCCSGFWHACPTNLSNPASCPEACGGGLRRFYRVKLYDCCAQCASHGTENKAGCSYFGDDYCWNEGYCPDGCGTYANGWRVKC